MMSGRPLADELWGDHVGKQQEIRTTVHSCGMEQPFVSISSYSWAMDLQWPSKQQPPLPSTLPKLRGQQTGCKCWSCP